MIEIRTHLNKAAYLIIRGARLVAFEGKHWYDCIVVVEIERERLDEINQARDYTVDYKKYMLLRSKLKMKMRRKYGYKMY